MGLEPTTFAVTGRRCNQLNYAPAQNLEKLRLKSKDLLALTRFVKRPLLRFLALIVRSLKPRILLE